MLVATWSGMALCRALGRFRSLLLCLDNLAPSQHSRPNWLRGELAEALRQPCSTDFSFFLSFSILLLVLFVCFCYFSFAFRFLCFMVQSAMQLSISPVDDEDFGGKLACSVCYAVAVPNCSASGRFSGSQGELPGGDGTGQVRTHQWKKTVSCSHTVRTVFQCCMLSGLRLDHSSTQLHLQPFRR